MTAKLLNLLLTPYFTESIHVYFPDEYLNVLYSHDSHLLQILFLSFMLTILY